MKLRRSYGLIGVDLGSHAIKLAQIERAGSGLRLINARSITRPSGVEGVGVDWWEAALAQEQLADQFVGTAAACVASAPSAELQLLTLPEGSRSERRAMLEGELAAQRAEPVESYAFDFWSIPQQSAAVAQENVAVATLAITDGERIAAAIAGAGLVCTCIEPKPLALARSLSLAFGDRTSPVAVLDWGYEQAALSVVQAGRPAFYRSFRDCGYKRIVDAVVHALEVSQDDAQVLLAAENLRGLGAPSGTSMAASKAIDGLVQRPLQALTSELQKTLHYLGEHRRHLQPSELLLCGGGATIGGIAARLAERLSDRVQSWQCGPLTDFGLLAASAPVFAGAIGLSGLKWSGDDDL